MSIPNDSPLQVHQQNRSGLRRMASATGILLAAQILGAMLQLLALRTVQDTLSKAANGEFYWIQQVSFFVYFVLVEMGLTTIAMRMVVQDAEHEWRVIATVVKMRMMLWFVSSIGLLFFCWLASPQILLEMSIYAVFSLIGARTLLLRPALELHRRSRNMQMLPAMTGLLDTICFLVLIFVDSGHLTPLHVMVCFLISAIPGFCIILFADKQWQILWRERIDIVLVKRLLRECLPLLSILLLMQFQGNSDMFALDYFYGKEAVGVYAAAIRLMAQALALLMMLPTVIAPVVSALRMSNEERCKTYMVEGLNLTLLLGILIAGGITALANPLIFITAGTKYLANTNEFSLAAWSVPPGMLIAYTLSLLTAIGEQKRMLLTVVVLGIVSVACNLVFTPEWGALGALTAKLISTLAAGLFALRALHSFVGGTVLQQSFLRIVIVSVVMVGASVLAQKVFQALYFSMAINFVLSGLSICVIFVGICAATGLLSREKIALVRSLLKR